VERIIFQCFKKICTSRILTQMIFNVDICPNDDCNCPYWDLTTLMLKKTLNKYVKNQHRVLEIGTGPFALLSIYIAKKKIINITAAEINPSFINNAKKNLLKNNVTIDLINSDLFSKTDGSFDIVFFNPPYVPLPWMLKNHKEIITESVLDQVWNGGEEGCDTITRFLEDVPKFIHGDSIVLLGVNSLFVDTLKMVKLINSANLRLVSIVSSIANPSKVYIIKTNKSSI
jgi:HemK-related putative methylase